MKDTDACMYTYECLKSGRTLFFIAKELNVPLETLIKSLQERNFLYVKSKQKRILNNTKIIEFIIETRSHGIPLEYLSKKLGCTKRTISDFITDAGLNLFIVARRKIYNEAIIKSFEEKYGGF